MTDLELNEALLEAVAHGDWPAIKECLQNGADIHYVRSIDSPAGPQPVTVLSMVMFRISDSTLDTPELLKFREITAFLLAHGAGTEHAMALAEDRYGPYDDTLSDEHYTVMPPWRLIAKAHLQRQNKLQ